MNKKLNYWLAPLVHLNEIPREEKEKSLIAKVCKTYGIKVDDLKIKTRKRHIVEARHVLCYLLRKCCDYTFQEIADIFNKDHSTVIYGVNMVSNYMEVDKSMEKKIGLLVDYCRFSFFVDKGIDSTVNRRSMYKGVTFHKHSKKWRSTIHLGAGKTKNLGYFGNEYDAHIAYQLENKKLTVN